MSNFESNKLESIHATNPAETQEEITPEDVKNEIIELSQEVIERENFIKERIVEIDAVRQKLGMPLGHADVPVLDQARADIEKNLRRKAELEDRLRSLMTFDISDKYADVIESVRQSKIDWAHSTELERRLKLKGADDEDVEKIREWLVDNASGTKAVVLSGDLFHEVVDVLSEMSSVSLKDGHAFYVPGGRDDVPEHVKNSVFIQEFSKPPRPPVPGQERGSNKLENETGIDTDEIHHEFGHSTQDGLLDSELYSNWDPKIKEGAPDPEYIGLLTETDTRVRSMFRDLSQVFDPAKESFGLQHIAMLQTKKAEGRLSKDTLDLLNHYDDAELIKIANTLPAI